MLIDHLTLIKLIEKASFSQVYLYENQATNEKYALKKIEKENEKKEPQLKAYIENEINILKGINHPNLLKLYEVKKTPEYYFLLTEYCNGLPLLENLNIYQNKFKKPFSEEIVQYFMKQIISGIKYLQDKNIIHRDISLSNILLNFDSEEDLNNQNLLNAKIKIIDFGFSRYLDKKELAYSTLGAPLYMEPIILKKLISNKSISKNLGYNNKCDIWSLGICCYEMLTGESPFQSENLEELFAKVEKGEYFLPMNLSEETISFINGMLQYDANKRMNIDELSNHLFLKKQVSEFTKIDINKYINQIVESKIKMSTRNEELKEKEKVEKGKENLEEKIKELEKKLKEEISKNNNLNNKVDEINKELNLEKNKNSDLTKINENLKKELLNKKEIKDYDLNKGINENISEDTKLNIELNKKIGELKEKLELYPFELLKGEKLLSVNFISDDSDFHYSIICKNSDKFCKLEEKFYEDNPYYYKEGNYFMIEEKIIDNMKSLDDNNIHNNDTIIFKKVNKKNK